MGGDIDTIAERIRQLEDVAPAGLQEFLYLSVIKETESGLMDERETAKALLADIEKLGDTFYESIEIAESCDKVTSNILQDITGHMDKIKWFLKSICSKK